MAGTSLRTKIVWAAAFAAVVVLTLVLSPGVATGKGPKPFSIFYGPAQYTVGDSEIGVAGAGFGQRTCTHSPYIEGNVIMGMRFDLPNGAQIVKVTAWFMDTDETYDLTFNVGFSEVGLADVLDGFDEARSSTDGIASPVFHWPQMQRVELVPSVPIVVDAANRDYSLGALFEACGTTSGTPGVDEFPTLLLDGVRVDYIM